VEVKLKSVIVTNGKIVVSFSTTFGTATATWNAPLPNVGDEYDVELDIDDDFFWGENAYHGCNEDHLLSVENNLSSINGMLISAHIDGFAAIKLAGSVVIIFMAGYTGIVPTHITLKAKKLSITPTGI
jgi:hypothetical protein